MVHLERRFWPKVEKTNTCWLWHGGIHKKTGYGAFGSPGVSILAHRFAWEAINGPIPPGMEVCHTCDVKSCVRNDGIESHLFLGTQTENMMDKVRKGRAASGDHNGARLHPDRLGRRRPMMSSAIVATIRERLALGETGARIARTLGISNSAVSAVKHRKRHSIG